MKDYQRYIRSTRKAQYIPQIMHNSRDWKFFKGSLDTHNSYSEITRKYIDIVSSDKRFRSRYTKNKFTRWDKIAFSCQKYNFQCRSLYLTAASFQHVKTFLFSSPRLINVCDIRSQTVFICVWQTTTSGVQYLSSSEHIQKNALRFAVYMEKNSGSYCSWSLAMLR
jgi:hypothetical protein